MIKNKKKWKIDTIFSLAVFCSFVMSAAATLIMGGNVYKSTVDKSQDSYNENICLSYIWTKVKSHDETGAVHVGEFAGISALCLDKEYDGIMYRTNIYLYDGWIYELFCENSFEFLPEDGTRVFKAESLSFEQPDENLISIKVNSKNLLISPRCKTETGYTHE